MNPVADLTTPIVQTAAALAIVLGGMLGLYYIARRLIRRNGVTAAHPWIRVVDRHYLGFKKQVSLIQVPGALLVLGLSNDSITLLTKIDDRDILDKLPLIEQKEAGPSFADHLMRLTQRMKSPNG
jgi:flagellar protein FliO/FliZ